MKKMSEICWEAANTCLWDGAGNGGCVHSCPAVMEAARRQPALGMLYADTVGVSFAHRADFSQDCVQAQGERYMLLLFASYYFEDIGQ